MTNPSWDAEVATHPSATVFHSAAWADVLQRTYGHHLCYARLADNASSTPSTALVPLAEVRSPLTGRRGVSLPFTDFCEPALVFQPRPAHFDALCALGRSRGWRHLELRGESMVPAHAAPSTTFVAHELDLSPGPDRVEAAFAPATRRAVRKAQTSDLTVEISGSLDAVRAYYGLHIVTRRRHGAPPQPWSFFLHLQNCLLERNLGFVVLARKGGRVVAGAIFLHAGQHAVYKFGAADLAFQALRPSNLVMATAIRHLAEKGFSRLNFGRTSVSNEGLRHFKLGWGSIESTVRYYRYQLESREWLVQPDRSRGIHAQFFRRLPAIVNRAFGAWLYPHLD